MGWQAWSKCSGLRWTWFTKCSSFSPYIIIQSEPKTAIGGWAFLSLCLVRNWYYLIGKKQNKTDGLRCHAKLTAFWFISALFQRDMIFIPPSKKGQLSILFFASTRPILKLPVTQKLWFHVSTYFYNIQNSTKSRKVFNLSCSLHPQKLFPDSQSWHVPQEPH